MAETILII